eukprot:2479062-Rhodomonas_salina.1
MCTDTCDMLPCTNDTRRDPFPGDFGDFGELFPGGGDVPSVFTAPAGDLLPPGALKADPPPFFGGRAVSCFAFPPPSALSAPSFPRAGASPPSGAPPAVWCAPTGCAGA